MLGRGYKDLALGAVVLALVFSLTTRSNLNAAGPDTPTRLPRSLAQELINYANQLNRTLHVKPAEQRSDSEYLRALDAYGQVTRLNTDTYYSAESLMRIAELQREMADAANDPARYQQAIATLRRIVNEHPQSTYVGDALISIAQVYEENLQDLDGAARAYRELIDYFPSSVMAREARAVLARFEAQLRDRPTDVLITHKAGEVNEASPLDLSRPRLNNVRNFGGPDYARVVIDLSAGTHFSESSSGGNLLSIRLSQAVISSALYDRRFIVNPSGLLKRITVVGEGGSVRVDIHVGSYSDYSVFRLAEPERLVVDIYGGRAPVRAARTIARSREELRAVERDDPAKHRSRAPAAQGATLSLPEITDPILPFGPTESHSGSGDRAATVTVDAKQLGEAPVRCVVIDPGHGGHDTGTISDAGLREKELVLDVARRLRSYIKRNYPDIEVVLTRESDRFVPLEERTAIANSRHADLFISVHANASPSRRASGVETFFVSPDRAKTDSDAPNAAETAKPATLAVGEQGDAKPEPIVASVRVGNRVAESRELARYIQAGLVRGIGAASPRTAANRGVKHAAFAVLVGAAMPSVLAEVSFMSNPRDDALLQTSHFRERIAASLFAGLNGYLKRNRAADGKSK